MMIQVFGGVIMYDSKDISSVFQNFNAGYQELATKGLPLELTVQQMFFNALPGRVYGIGFMWSSDDMESGHIWCQRMAALGPVVMNTVKAIAIPEWLGATAGLVPSSVYGSSQTHNVRKMSNQVTDIIGRHLQRMPSDPATMFSIHELRGHSAHANNESVFGTREPHFMLEIIGCSTDPENREASLQWALHFWKDLHQVDRDNLLPGAYISLDPLGQEPGQVGLSRIYGSNDRELLALKQEFDSENVFDLAVPRLKNYI